MSRYKHKTEPLDTVALQDRLIGLRQRQKAAKALLADFKAEGDETHTKLFEERVGLYQAKIEQIEKQIEDYINET